MKEQSEPFISEVQLIIGRKPDKLIAEVEMFCCLQVPGFGGGVLLPAGSRLWGRNHLKYYAPKRWHPRPDFGCGCSSSLSAVYPRLATRASRKAFRPTKISSCDLVPPSWLLSASDFNLPGSCADGREAHKEGCTSCLICAS